MVNYQSSSLALQAVESLLPRKLPGASGGGEPVLEILLVDSHSSKTEREILRRAELPSCVRRFFLDENVGYGRGNNFAWERSRGEYALIINPDTVVDPGAVGAMVDYLAVHGDCGAVGPKTFWDEERRFVLSPTEPLSILRILSVRLAHHFPAWGKFVDRRYFDASLRYWRAKAPVTVSMLSGGCFMVPRRVIERIGLFDPRFPLYFEDADWCLRARRAGYRLAYLPSARIAHFVNQSGRKEEKAMGLFQESMEIFLRKHEGEISRRLLPVLENWAARWGEACFSRRKADREDAGTSSFKDLGEISQIPPDLPGIPQRGARRYLLQISNHPVFLHSFGGFFPEPSFRFTPSMWKRLWPGRFFARWVALPSRRSVGCWTWSKT